MRVCNMESAEERAEARTAGSPLLIASTFTSAASSPRPVLSQYATPNQLSSTEEDERSRAAATSSGAGSPSASPSGAANAPFAHTADASAVAAPASQQTPAPLEAAAGSHSPPELLLMPAQRKPSSPRNPPAAAAPPLSSLSSRSLTATPTPAIAGPPRKTPPQTPRTQTVAPHAAAAKTPAGLPTRRVSVPTRPAVPEPSAAAASVLPKAVPVTPTASGGPATPSAQRKSIAVPPELAPPSYATVVTETFGSQEFLRSTFGSTPAQSGRRSLRVQSSEQLNTYSTTASAPSGRVERAGFQRLDVAPTAVAERPRRLSQRRVGSPHALLTAGSSSPPPALRASQQLPVPAPVHLRVDAPAAAPQSREYSWSGSDAENEGSRRASRRELRDAANEEEDEATSESSTRSGASTPTEEVERQRVSEAEVELFQKLWKPGVGPLERSNSLRAEAAGVEALLSRDGSTRSWPKRSHMSSSPKQRAHLPLPQVHRDVETGDRDESDVETSDFRRGSPMNTSLVRNPNAPRRSRGSREDRARQEKRERRRERLEERVESPMRAGRKRLDFETLLAMSPIIATPATGRSDRVTFIMRELVVKYLSERPMLAEVFAPEPPSTGPAPQTLFGTLSQMSATASESLSRWFERFSELLAADGGGGGGGKRGAAGAKRQDVEASEQSETRSSEQELEESAAEAEWHTSGGRRRAHTWRQRSQKKSREKSRPPEKEKEKRSSSRSRSETRSSSSGSKRNPFCDAYYGIFDDFESEFDFDKLALLLVCYCTSSLFYSILFSF